MPPAPIPPAPVPPAPVPPAPIPPEQAGELGTRHRTGVEYATLVGFRPLLLDLVLPPRTGAAAPVVVFLHGGGWQAGSRRSAGPGFAALSPTPFVRLAAAGYAVAAVDYRLSAEAVWPAQLQDVAAALRWLGRDGPGLGLDPARLVLWGESAGGHLAALAGLLARHPDRGGAPVAAVVDWYGPADLRTMAAQLGPGAATDPDALDSRESRLLGAALPTVPELAADASPVTHVTADAPPFLLVHGTADRLVPYAQSVDLAAALRRCGVPVRLEPVEGADHMWLGPDPDAPARVLDLTLQFLREHVPVPG